jgi:hypothetical protein
VKKKIDVPLCFMKDVFGYDLPRGDDDTPSPPIGGL